VTEAELPLAFRPREGEDQLSGTNSAPSQLKPLSVGSIRTNVSFLICATSQQTAGVRAVGLASAIRPLASNFVMVPRANRTSSGPFGAAAIFHA